jgi:hypothetical protein
MDRKVSPEALDDLDPADPRAVRARLDLQRIHRAMGSLSILKSLIARLRWSASPRSILELGAGDGTLLLRLANALGAWQEVELRLLDRHNAVTPETLSGFRKLGWRASVSCENALIWARASAVRDTDLCVTTLFLHHFDDTQLRLLLAGIARRCRAFIAVEPRRDVLARAGSRLVGVLGASALTRGDAITSVAAGFAAREISDAWPKERDGWHIREFRALPFSHCFLAQQLPASRDSR